MASSLRRTSATQHHAPHLHKDSASDVQEALLEDRVSHLLGFATCCAHRIYSRAQYLLTHLWRLPVQLVKLTFFFVRLGLYVVFLAPAFFCGFMYWVWPRRDILCVRYKQDGGCRHTCDVYLPIARVKEKATGKHRPPPTAPVVVIIAGGAWIIGHKAYVSMLCRALRCAGLLCIAVDYRYWPQVSIDGMVEDNKAALEWSLRNCANYGGDRKRMAVVGLSSGAHIGALLLAQRASAEIDGEADKSAGRPLSCGDIVGFIGLGGIYNLDKMFMHHLHKKGIDYVLQRLIFGTCEAEQESLSPDALVRMRPAVAERMPPMLFVHGTDDKIAPVEQSKAFIATLQDAGATDVRLILRQGQGHNDPVIHSPLMSDNATVRDIVLHMWRWNAWEARPRAGLPCEALSAGTARQIFKDGHHWERAAETACRRELIALPKWPRYPELVVAAARLLTPF